MTDTHPALTAAPSGPVPATLMLPAQNLTVDATSTIHAVPTPAPALKVDHAVLILRGPSPNPLLIALVEDPDSRAAPFRLVAVPICGPTPPQLASVPHVSALPPHLDAATAVAVDYLVSTRAGTGRAAQFWTAVLLPLLRIATRALARDAMPRSVVVTDSDETIREYARGSAAAATARGRRRTVVLLSGDGGVADLLNHSAPAERSSDDNDEGSLPSIVLIPLGTGNALFHSLHKPLLLPPTTTTSGLIVSLRTLFCGVAAPLPTFTASFPTGSRVIRYREGEPPSPSPTPVTPPPPLRHDAPVSSLRGCVVASYGLHASIVHESDTPAHRRHGPARFALVARALLEDPHAYAAHVSVRRTTATAADLQRIPLENDDSDTHAYVLCALVSNLERTFAVSPASRPLDGRLRLLRFGPVGGRRIMDVMSGAYGGGTHVGLRWDDVGEAVFYDVVEELRVRVDDGDERWRKVCVDGTIVDVPRGGEVSIVREETAFFNVVVDARIL